MRLAARVLARAFVLSFALLVSLAPEVSAQSNFARPGLDWMTARTRYFDVHYPASMTEWTRDLVTRLDAVHDAVSAFVGFAPKARITVIIEDPAGQSNGFANPPLATPLIVFWPTPPDPSGMLGMYRDWPELLAVHEYAHIAHLTRPTRNPSERRFWRYLPLTLGPVAMRAPRWAIEGYATFVEGRLTGSGRPHGAARAAYLRQWALEGRLPTYPQLSASGDFMGGAMAYLAGSAFFEWLVGQRGDSSLVHVWRRMSARTPRTFEQAFAGVYGAPPDEMYGRFSVELTRRALAVRDTLMAVSADTGIVVQRRRWATGEPAFSRDGRRIAIELPNRVTAGPVVVWRTHERVDTTRERRARERVLQQDPEDVLSVSTEPRAKAPMAMLRPSGGRGFHAPRFFADTTRILVSHDDPLGDGAYRPDLYEWNYRSGGVRRITHGASIREADPLPDGRTAVGVKCDGGICDLIRVDLASGNTTVIRKGAPNTPFQRPRVSPDGRSIAVSTKHDGVWRIAIVPVDGAATDGDGGSELTFADPNDGANRYDASFTPDGRGLVYVSERGGIPNVETMPLDSRTPRTLTRTSSAAFAPVVSETDTSVYFLSLHARGLDLRRIPIAPTTSATVVAFTDALAPAVPLMPQRVDTFPRTTRFQPQPYGAGPHRHRVLPGGSYSTEGAFVSLALYGVDPLGRFSYSLNGGFGEPSTWRGGSITASWRGSKPVVPGVMSLDGTIFHAEQRPSQQRAWRDVRSPAGTLLDASYTGATLGTSTMRDYGVGRVSLRIGGNLGFIERPGTDQAVRGLAFGEARGVARVRRGTYRTDVALGVHASRGGTDGLSWARAIGTMTTDVATPFGTGRLDVTLGGSDRGGGTFERFAIGGWSSPFVDGPALSQRIAMPVLPAGFMVGPQLKTMRASLGLGPVRPYYWMATTRESFTGFARVAGVDVDYPLEAFPAFAIPAMSVRLGTGYSWNEPFRHRLGLYAGVMYRP